MLNRGDALLIVDVQFDFLPGGALAVPYGDDVVTVLADAVRAIDPANGTQALESLRERGAWIVDSRALADAPG